MMSMPPGPPPTPPSNPFDDDAAPDRHSDADEDDAAAAEALGYADPEDAPITTGSDGEHDGVDDGEEAEPSPDDAEALRDAQLRKAEEAEHPQPSIRPEANPYTGPA